MLLGQARLHGARVFKLCVEAGPGHNIVITL